MTLTEQWKKGELEQGYYYTKYTPKVGKPFVEIELRNYLLDLAKVRDVDTVEVLAPVPSYEEWQELKEASDGLSKLMFKSLMNRFVKADEERERLSEENQQLRKWCEEFNALEVAKENQQLKTLLKEWMHFYPIILYEHEDTLKTKDIVELYDKTRGVLK